MNYALKLIQSKNLEKPSSKLHDVEGGVLRSKEISALHGLWADDTRPTHLLKKLAEEKAALNGVFKDPFPRAQERVQESSPNGISLIRVNKLL